MKGDLCCFNNDLTPITLKYFNRSISAQEQIFESTFRIINDQQLNSWCKRVKHEIIEMIISWDPIMKCKENG